MKRIKLTKGKFALVDDDDFERLNKFKWCASHESRGTKWYAVRWTRVDGKKAKIRMHYEALELKRADLAPDYVIDHIQHPCWVDHEAVGEPPHTGDGLDNRRCGLEIITQAENMHRSPGWKKKMDFLPE